MDAKSPGAKSADDEGATLSSMRNRAAGENTAGEHDHNRWTANTGRASPATKDADSSPPPRRTSARQIEANRRNALHSTGPTTPKGKQVSRLNALKYGLRAKELIIPGQEDPAEFEAI